MAINVKDLELADSGATKTETRSRADYTRMVL